MRGDLDPYIVIQRKIMHRVPHPSGQNAVKEKIRKHRDITPSLLRCIFQAGGNIGSGRAGKAYP